MKTAVIILNYNGAALLQHYLPSVIKSVKNDAEVIVADNGSTDDSVKVMQEEFANVKLLAFDKNYGFAEGYNKAIREVEADYVVLLNSDVETPIGWLEPLVEHMDAHIECAALQPKIIADKQRSHFEYAGAAGGFIDRYGYPFCRGRILDNVEEDRGQYDTPTEVFWATGACLVVRRDIYLEVGGLDARFFAHQEEIDLCWRLKSRGYSIQCIPSSTIYHLGGGSLGYESPRKTYLNFRNNQLLLYKNMQKEEYKWVVFARFFLDIAAAMNMLVHGKSSNCNAVFKAWRDFLKEKKTFKKEREENLRKSVVKKIPEQLNLLLITKVYIHKRTTFKELTNGFFSINNLQLEKKRKKIWLVVKKVVTLQRLWARK